MKALIEVQLEKLHEGLKEMGTLTADTFALALEALRGGDRKLAMAVGEAESQIERHEREIENLCLRTLLTRQPYADDLRAISAALKVITDLQRIGHQSADIAEILQSEAVLPPGEIDGFNTLADEVAAAVRESAEAFVGHDVERARVLIRNDDTIDALYADVRNAISMRIPTEQNHCEALVNNLMIAKYFERIGDHAVLICRRCVQESTGEW